MMNRILKRFLFASFVAFFLLSVCITVLYGQNLKEQFFPIIILSIIFSAILSLLIQYFYIDPISKLIRMTSRIALADFSERVRLFRSDALGDLAHNLNEMSVQLKSRMDDIVRDKKEMEAVLSSMIDGVAVIGSNEQILHMSPSTQKLLDLRSQKTIGKRYWEVIRYDEINSLIKQVIQERQPLTTDVFVLTPQEKYLNVLISPVLNESGDLSSVVAVFHDVSEMKRFEKMRSDFVANVSHELKTPLTSIKGFVETLKDGAIKDAQKANHFLSIIEDQAGRLENLVSDLLSLSSLESEGQQLSKSEESLRDIMSRVLTLLKNDIDDHGHVINLHCDNNVPNILVDRASLEQVFLNLVNNAIKFTPDQGCIDIRIVRDSDWVRVDVQDNGIGIEKQHLERLFERFYRVDKARSRDLGGTGLGLSIVKHIMSAHQGRIQVESDLGSGSLFSLFFPLICK